MSDWHCTHLGPNNNCFGQSGHLPENIKKIYSIELRVSVQGVESLWGDCRFIPADWGS